MKKKTWLKKEKKKYILKYSAVVVFCLFFWFFTEVFKRLMSAVTWNTAKLRNAPGPDSDTLAPRAPIPRQPDFYKELPTANTQNSACAEPCPAPEGARKRQLRSPIAAPSSHPLLPHPSRTIQRGQSLAVFLKSSPKQSLCYCTLLSLYFITYLFSFLQFASRGIDPRCSTDRRVCEMSKLHPLVDRQKSMEQRLLSST